MEDYELIKDYCWSKHTHQDGYVSLDSHKINSGRGGGTVRFHQLIGCKGYDHINRNTLDNRKSNLRRCTPAQNCSNISLRSDNKSGVIGVSVANEKGKSKWRATLRTGGKTYRLGAFADKDAAIRARLAAERALLGEFAPQKHLFEIYLKGKGE